MLCLRASCLRTEIVLRNVNRNSEWRHVVSHSPPPAPGHLGKAVRYLLNQGEDIETYIHHGQVEIDNNRIERDVRPLAVGRKNWLFIGSPETGLEVEVKR